MSSVYYTETCRASRRCPFRLNRGLGHLLSPRTLPHPTDPTSPLFPAQNCLNVGPRYKTSMTMLFELSSKQCLRAQFFVFQETGLLMAMARQSFSVAPALEAG